MFICLFIYFLVVCILYFVSSFSFYICVLCKLTAKINAFRFVFVVLCCSCLILFFLLLFLLLAAEIKLLKIKDWLTINSRMSRSKFFRHSDDHNYGKILHLSSLTHCRRRRRRCRWRSRPVQSSSAADRQRSRCRYGRRSATRYKTPSRSSTMTLSHLLHSA